MRACSSLLVKYGGHPAAAGVTQKPEHIPEFRRALATYANTVNVGSEAVKPETSPRPPRVHAGFRSGYSPFRAIRNWQCAPVFGVRNAILGKAKPYAFTLTQGKHTVHVRHAEGVDLNFAQIERDYLVEATTGGLELQGLA
jgi:hypothetical protein